MGPAASHKAWSSGLPPTACPSEASLSVARSAQRVRVVASVPSAGIARSKSRLPRVKVPVLSVKTRETSPRSSMQTRRLTSTFTFASRELPAARLVETTAGSSWGVMPTAMARENINASSRGFCRNTLIAKIATVSAPPT